MTELLFLGLIVGFVSGFSIGVMVKHYQDQQIIRALNRRIKMEVEKK